MEFLPLYIDITNQPVLVVGAGEIGLRKTRLLLEAGAAVTVIGEEVDPGFPTLPQAGLTVIVRAFAVADIQGARLVIAATDDEALNDVIFKACEAVGILVNAVDDPAHSRFIFPAIIDRSPIIISISSGGHAPVLARQLREKLEAWIPASVALAGQFAKEMRQRVKNALPFDQRRRFWEMFFTGAIPGVLAAGKRSDADTLFSTLLEGGTDASGEVYIVGAGTGDPELLTIKALQCMHKADVIVHDGLVSNEILALARRDAERISVAKSAGKHTLPQDEINTLLVKLAKEGKRVCRLKGGDPFIYGRGGEECEALVANGIRFQVVPGITAAAGCSAYAGIPLTHRDFAQTIQLVTGHTRKDGREPDWNSLAASQQTVVVYMGLGTSTLYRDRLIAHGRSETTPVAIIEDGTRPSQRVVSGVLGDLPDLIEQNGITSPALVVIGEVAALANQLQWYGDATTKRLDTSPIADLAAET